MSEMIKEDACTVIAVNGRKVTVEVCSTDGCKACSMNGFCGAGHKDRYFTIETDVPVKVGDKVVLKIYGGSEVISSLILFLLPILFMIFGFVLGKFILHYSEGTSTLISIGGLALSFFVVRLIDYLYGKKISMDIVSKDAPVKEDQDENHIA